MNDLFKLLAEFGSVFSWVGGNDLTTEGVFLSECGSSTYFNWRTNEPNDWRGNEDCVLLWGTAMNDYTCTSKHAVTCKTNPPLNPQAIVDVVNIPGYETSIYCPSNHVYQRNGMK